jgi:hypothetical protein
MTAAYLVSVDLRLRQAPGECRLGISALPESLRVGRSSHQDLGRLRVQLRQIKSNPTLTHPACPQRQCTGCIVATISTRGISSVDKPSVPKISEWPHLKVFDLHILLLLGLHPVFSWSPPSSWRRSVGLGFRAKGSLVTHDLLAVDFFFVFARARCARPAITSTGFR